MSLLDILGGSDGLGRLARQLEMDEGRARDLAGTLTPALSHAARRRAEEGQIGDLLNQARGSAETRYYDEPETAATPEARGQGEEFLARIFGSREATHQFAREAAGRTGGSQTEIETLLPALAAMLKGGMQKKTPDSSIDGLMSALDGQGPSGGAGGGLMGMFGALLDGGGRTAGTASRDSGQEMSLDAITRFFDRDGDGSALDDIVDQVMGRRG